MDIAKGRYWDLAVNPIIIDNCSCEVGDHCWAKQMINRGLPNIKPGWFPERLDNIPLSGKSKVYAVNWLCDIAHKSVNQNYVLAILERFQIVNNLRKANPNANPHTFLFLTKFPERLYKAFQKQLPCNQRLKDGIWIGTSITGANDVDHKRVHDLIKFEGFKKWISYEPCLESLELNLIQLGIPLNIDQVIVGAETGKNARPCDPDALRWIRDFCADWKIPFFLKQIDKTKNRVLDERTHDELEWE